MQRSLFLSNNLPSSPNNGPTLVSHQTSNPLRQGEGDNPTAGGSHSWALAKSVSVLAVLICGASLGASRMDSRVVRVEPNRRIQDLVEQFPEGTTIEIASGVHRLESVVPKDGDVFVGEPGAILSGAALLTTFERQGKYWVARRSVPSVEAHGKCDPQHPACTFPEDLFLDDVPLRRVLHLADVTAHSWYLDYAAACLYLADDPTSHKVELSVVRHAFYGAASHVTIRGLVIEKYANPAQTGAIHALRDPGPLSRDWVVERNEIRLNHGAGVRLGHGTQLLRNRIHHNGQLGVGGSGDSIRVEENEIAANNYAGYDMDWEAGGTKFSFTRHLVVRNNDVHDNRGPGLWTDGDNEFVLYEGNRSAANLAAGIKHEISFAAVIRDNVLDGDGFNPGGTSGWWGAGIHILSSSDVEIYRNTLRNCLNGIVAVQGDRASSRSSGGPYLVQHLYVHDNTILQSSGTAAGIVKDARFDDSVFKSWGNRFRHNAYQLAAPQNKFYEWMNAPRTWEEWQAFANDTGEVPR